MVDNHPLYSNIQLSQNIDLPDDDIPDEIWSMMTLHDDTGKEDEKEHTTYTPQADTPDFEQEGMDSSGLLDVEGISVSTSS